ncbi:restriction endonuclease subunit S [Brumimicrobium oceani]|uniref:restriction endonuclease subunit S n=1 Tax=Brumimicrobium oceani TaxID=2100725 RepID=UPI001304AA41|nr:restriction endonuclease subunit S [Brumimicrobium oceani]
MAIQGKLTGHWRKENPGIESASELLKDIIKNKEVLIKSKIARKENAKKEFLKDKVSFLIPETWISKNITEFYYTIGGKSNQIQSKNYSETGKYPIVSQGKNRIDGYSDDESKLLKITKPIIVFGDHTRLVKFIDFDFIIGADGTKILSPFDGVDSEYFYLHTSSYDLSSKGYARHYSLLKLEAFALPPLEEQKEIVKIVETLFKEVEQLEQLTVERIALKEDFVTSALNQLTSNNANQEWSFLQEHFKPFFNETTNIKKLRETVLQLAVQGKLTADWRANNPNTEDASVLLKRIQEEKAQLIKDKKIKKEKALPEITEEDIPYELPEGWVWCRLNEILHSSFYGPRFGKEEYVDNGVPTIRTTDMNSKGFIKLKNPPTIKLTEEKLKLYKVEKGDLLVTRTGSIGTMAIFNEEYDAIPSAYLIRFRFLIVNIEYVFNLMHSPYGQKSLGLLTNTVAQPNINATSIKDIPFPLPPLEEQKAIVEKVNAIMGLCDALEQEVQQSQAHSEMLMQSVLREVFEG